MIDWLKYYPIELRNDHSLENRETPKGPDFSKSKTYDFNIDNNVISFKCPQHRPYKSYYESFTASEKQDLSKLKFHEFNRDTMPDDSWLSQTICKRDWAFYGPWFTGPQYQLSLSVSIITKRNHPENESFLYPSAFENAIASYLTSLYAHDIHNDSHNWNAPVNWKSISMLDIFAARFDATPSTDNDEGQLKHTLCFPVTDRHILLVEFTPRIFSYNKKISYDNLLKLIDTKPMFNLIENIISSFSIKPTQEIISVISNPDNNSTLTKSFPPLKWDRDLGAFEGHTDKIAADQS